MGLTNEAVEGELEYSYVRKSEDDRRGWEDMRTWTAKAVFPTPPSPNTATRQQSISGKEGGDREGARAQGGDGTDLNHDG
jgi:hypothetical protein